MSASSDYQRAILETATEKARALSQAASNNANLWGNTISTIGQQVAQYPEQQAKLKEIANRADLTNLEKQKFQAQQSALQKEQQDQQQTDQMFATFQQNEDGTYPTADILKGLATKGIAPAHIQKFGDMLEGYNKIQASQNEQNLDHTAKVADLIIGLHGKDEPIDSTAVHTGLTIAQRLKLANQSDVDQINGLLADNPDAGRQILEGIRKQGKSFKASYEPLPTGSSGVLNKATGEVTPTGMAGPLPKTKDELAVALKDPNDPRHQQYQDAWDLIQTAPTDAKGELKPVRVNGKMVFAVFDPGTKKLMYQGQDVTQTAEPPRDPVEAQAAGIAAQVAAENRRESFAEGQAGRKELTDNVIRPWQTAKAGVGLLKDTVNAAKAGNKVAGSMQSLQSTMSTLKAEGFNRINTAEINSTADAGSLFDRISGWVGKATEGQPIPADVQKDMLAYADILERSAYKKYSEGFDSTLKTYQGLQTQQKEPPPGGAGSSAVPAVGSTFQGGKVLKVTPVP